MSKPLKKKIIITGDLHIGKTTIINKLKEYLYSNNIQFGGFKTFSKTKDNNSYVYIIPLNSEYKLSKENCICYKPTKTFFVKVFDNYGYKILLEESKYDILIFDEIGYIEDDSILFKNKLIELFNDKNKTIISVLRKNDTNLYKTLTSIKGIDIINLTRDNRDNIEIINQIKKAFA